MKVSKKLICSDRQSEAGKFWYVQTGDIKSYNMCLCFRQTRLMESQLGRLILGLLNIEWDAFIEALQSAGSIVCVCKAYVRFFTSASVLSVISCCSTFVVNKVHIFPSFNDVVLCINCCIAQWELPMERSDREKLFFDRLLRLHKCLIMQNTVHVYTRAGKNLGFFQIFLGFLGFWIF